MKLITKNGFSFFSSVYGSHRPLRQSSTSILTMTPQTVNQGFQRLADHMSLLITEALSYISQTLAILMTVALLFIKHLYEIHFPLCMPQTLYDSLLSGSDLSGFLLRNH